MVNNTISEQISDQVANQIALVSDMLFFNDMSFVKMVNANRSELVTASPTTIRHYDDIAAGCYAHTLAIDQGNGDDCVDHYGYSMELKLAMVSSDGWSFNGNDQLTKSSSITNTIGARFSVYGETKRGHHNKDTALVLYSADHRKFITGFILSGDHIDNYLNNGNNNTVDRFIPLSKFIADGYEFGSSVPHMGWERYYSALWYFLAAKHDKIPKERAYRAFTDWVNLSDSRYLKTL